MNEQTPVLPLALSLIREGGNANRPELRQLLEERQELGIKTYGEPLTTHSGHDMLQESLEECADAVLYLTALHAEGRNASQRARAHRALMHVVRALDELMVVKPGGVILDASLAEQVREEMRKRNETLDETIRNHACPEVRALRAPR